MICFSLSRTIASSLQIIASYFSATGFMKKALVLLKDTTTQTFQQVQTIINNNEERKKKIRKLNKRIVTIDIHNQTRYSF